MCHICETGSPRPTCRCGSAWSGKHRKSQAFRAGLMILFVLGCGGEAPQQVAPVNDSPAEAFPIIDPEDPQSIERWEQSRYNIGNSRIHVVELRLFHGTLGDGAPREPKKVPLHVYQARTTGITPEQQAAVDRLVRDEPELHAAVREAIYRYYKNSYSVYKEALSLGAAMFGGAEEIDQILPQITAGDELDDLVQIGGIYIHPAVGGSASIGMDFEVPWDEEHGIGLRLDEGKVAEIGMGHEAFPVPER